MGRKVLAGMLFLGVVGLTVGAQQIQDLTLECARPVYIVTTDFNRDSYPDLAIACHSCNSVVILPNLGQDADLCTQFDDSLAFSWELADAPTALATGYFLDPPAGQNFPYFTVFPNLLAVTQYQPGLARFSPLTPATPFLDFRDSPTPVPVPMVSEFATLTHVLVEDFTNDGAPEVVVLDGLTPKVGVYLGSRDPLTPAAPGAADGAGVEEGPDNVLPLDAQRAYFLAAADFDRDGLLDLVVAADGKVMFFQNKFSTAQGLQFRPPERGTPEKVVGTKVAGLAVADFNRDGYLDVAAVDPDFGALSILIHKGCWEFQLESRTKIEGDPVFVVPLDCDRNGLVDLAIAERATNQITLVLNQLVGHTDVDRPDGCQRTVPPPEKGDQVQLTVAFSFRVGPEPVGLAVADYDLNGMSDIAVVLAGGGPPGTDPVVQIIYNPCCCKDCDTNVPCCGEADSEVDRGPEEVGASPKG